MFERIAEHDPDGVAYAVRGRRFCQHARGEILDFYTERTVDVYRLGESDECVSVKGFLGIFVSKNRIFCGL